MSNLNQTSTVLSNGTLQQNQPLENIRPKQAAKELGYSISWLYELVSRGVLPKPHQIYKGSRAVAFYRHELEAAKSAPFNLEGGQ